MEPTQVSELSGSYLRPGAMLGSYRVMRFLGEGGMGQIYLVEHAELGRPAAVKVCRPEISGNPDAVRRFFQEARLVNAIRNEHIVDIFDMGQTNAGRVYSVMELLEGHTLGEAREHEGPFRLQRAVMIAQQVADALAAAHDKNIVHRDLKPDNVFLCTRGKTRDFVKLLDFGLAKLLEGKPSPDGTQAGSILGTARFMSPEQAAGANVDTRSDIYAFGLLLYWMLTDQLPFESAAIGGVAFDREARPLPKTSVAGDPLPPWVVALTTSCLANDPSARPASMHEVLRRLDEPTPGAGQPDSHRAITDRMIPASPRPVRRRLLAALTGLAMATLAGLALWLGTRKAPPPPLPTQATPPAAVGAAAPAAPPDPTPPGAPTEAANATPPRQPAGKIAKKRLKGPDAVDAMRMLQQELIREMQTNQPEKGLSVP